MTFQEALDDIRLKDDLEIGEYGLEDIVQAIAEQVEQNRRDIELLALREGINIQSRDRTSDEEG